MTTNFLYAQAPNRKGNISKRVPGMGGPLGVTAVTGPSHGVATPKGSQGAPNATGNIASRNQKVQVSTTKCYDKTPVNNAYMDKSTKNYLG